MTTSATGEMIEMLQLVGMSEISLSDGATELSRKSLLAACAVPLEKTLEAGVANTVNQRIVEIEGIFQPNPKDSPQEKANNAATLTYLEGFQKRPTIIDMAESPTIPLAPDTKITDFSITNNIKYDLKRTVQSGCHLSPDAAEKYTNILKGEGTKYVIADHPSDAKKIKQHVESDTTS